MHCASRLLSSASSYVVHITGRNSASDWHSFPHVRRTLARWGLLAEGEPTSAIVKKLGLEAVKAEIAAGGHPCDLMVLATQGREGLPRWCHPSIAEAMARKSRTLTLFIPEDCDGFVDEWSGALVLRQVVMPVDHQPPASAAIGAIRRQTLGADPQFHLVHVGQEVPAIPFDSAPIDVELRDGNIVEGILQTAAGFNADLIALPTAGHTGILDALRGSTTERVLRQALRPVLAVPVMSTV